MNKFSKLAAACAGIALVAGAGLSANAAPTPGPTATVTPQPTHMTPYPTTTTVTPAPSGTATPSPTVVPTTVTPTPEPTLFPQPTGAIPTGSLAYTFSDDCRTVSVTASGFPAAATELFLNYSESGNTIVGSDPEMARDKLTAGAGTASVTLKDGDAPGYVQVWVSGYVNGEELIYTSEEFLPQCAITAESFYPKAQVMPTVTYSVPSCTMDSRPTVPVTVTVTNNDTTPLSGWLSVVDYATQVLVPANDEYAVDIDGVAPGAQGQWIINLPRGFWGTISGTYNEERQGRYWRQQALNVEACVQDQTPRVAVDTATCEKPSFTILNPKDEYAQAATYKWRLVDASGKETTGSVDVADGASAIVTAPAAAGDATLYVGDAPVKASATVLSCSSGVKPAKTGNKG